MAGSYQHIQEFVDFMGIDLRSSEVTRPRGYFSDGTKNIGHTAKGGLIQRNGSKILASGYGKFGLSVFSTTSILGVKKTELIGFGAPLYADSMLPYRLRRGSFTLTNSHASVDATVTMLYDEATSQFRFKIVRTTTLTDTALGLGTEGSPYMLSSLETAVDALTSFAMSTPTNASTTPAAFMEIITSSTVTANGGTLTCYYWYWEETTSTETLNNLLNYAIEIGQSSYRNVSTAQINGVLYVSSGANAPPGTVMPGGTFTATEGLCKYDGFEYYIAGFRRYYTQQSGITSAASAGTAPTSLTDSKGTRTITQALQGVYYYYATFVHIDMAGNRYESDLLALSATVDYAASDKIGSYTPLAASLMGKSHRSCQINGAGAGTLTFTTDSGNNLLVGSVAYLWDNSQSRWIQREVTASSDTSITFSTNSLDNDTLSPNYDDGGVITLLDNAFITNNTRMAIYRTVAGGSELFLLEEIPFRSNVAQYDVTEDADLGEQYVTPSVPRGEPPSCRYLTAFNSQLVANGDDASPETTYYSDIDGCEYFPPTHNFITPSDTTGCHQAAESLVVTADEQIHVVSGDLSNFQFRVDRVGDKIGCVSHHSMQQIQEGVLVFLSKKGPYVLHSGRQLEPLGGIQLPDNQKASRIEPFFTQRYGASDEQPYLGRSLSAVLPNDQLYILFVPFEDPAEPGFATSSSVCWVYDYGRGAWWKWDSLNMAGGMTVMSDVLYWGSRTHDGAAGVDFDNVVTRNSQQQKDKGVYNYADHGDATSWVMRTHWESLGAPSKFKRFLRWRVSSHETRSPASCAVTLNTYVDYSTSNTSTSDTLTFTSQMDLRPKIKGEVCRAMMFALSASRRWEPFPITGHEIEAVAPFRPALKE